MICESGESTKVALVTGASYGIGAAGAIALARAGFDIVATDLNPNDLEQTFKAVKEEGKEAAAIALDLRDSEDMERAVDEAISAFGNVDVLVNNAGMPLTKPALEVGYAEFSEVMAVNVAGSYFMAQHFARHLISEGRAGAIINLASTFSVIGVPNVSPYGVSKAAVGGITRHLAIEWAAYGIRVNAVAPGAVETKLRAEMFSHKPELRQEALDKVPMKRFGTSEDMAGAIAYLASPAAAYVTGQVLVVDGGLTAA